MHTLSDEPIASREDLIDHLNVAAELEHTVLVQYLFAAFSMKKSTNERIKPHQEPLIKSWEKIILKVAREEMGHLGTVCNLLSAIGAAPHFGRPNFPQFEKTYFPFDIKLTRFCDEALYRFIRYELPKDESPPDPPASLQALDKARINELNIPVEYQFVGQLYGKIRAAFNRLDRLFIGPRFAQDADTWSARMNLFPVRDKGTASQAIDFIVTEGEGAPGHRQNSHYGAFLEIRKKLREECDADPGFEPSRNVIDNPRAMEKHADAPNPGNYISNQQTRKVADLFNDVYEIAVVMLMQFYSFGGETSGQRGALQAAAREIMSETMRPLGEILTELPALEPNNGSMAGAPFEFYSTLRLPPQAKPRWLMLLERLQNTADGIAAEAKNRPQEPVGRRLASIAEKLAWLRQNIETVLREEFVLTPHRYARSLGAGKPLKTSEVMTLKFNGWFQCRLATNPDPADEERGVSGFTYALPGEPKLDRIIRFQSHETVERPRCDPITIGVRVRQVYQNGSNLDKHPLVGAPVELLHEAKFVGENGIVVAQAEPIVPFHLCIGQGKLILSRPHADAESFPFDRDLFGKQPTLSPGEIGEATGIWNLKAIWKTRIERLQRDLGQSSDDIKKAALQMRIDAMSRGIDGLTAMFFGKVAYFIPLTGKPEVTDPNGELAIDQSADWFADFWMGGWDTDALSGFVSGFVTIPLTASSGATNEYANEQSDVSKTAR